MLAYATLAVENLAAARIRLAVKPPAAPMSPIRHMVRARRLMMRVAFAMVVIASSAAVGGAGAGGCSEPTGPRTVASEDLNIKIQAIRVAAEQNDLTAAPQLVKDLESDDAAVRMYAIMGLQEMNGGKDFGYVYYADDEQRRPAVAKWREWLGKQGAATRPASAR